MAKIKFGMMMTDARGKLGGQVFSKNRSGAYVRTKVTPVNPRTGFQQASRSILGTLSSSWSGLSNEVRTAWNSAVDSWQKTDVFGDLRKPTGKNLYTSLNKELLQSGQDQITTPPERVELPVLELENPTFIISSNLLGVDVTEDLSGYVIQVSATPQLSQGTAFIDDKLRVLDYVEGDSGLSVSVADVYNQRFGTPTPGANVWVQLKLIAPNGQTSVPVRAKVKVTAE